MAHDEAFLKSVNGTVFKDLAGNYISEVGKPWRDGNEVVIVTAWNQMFEQDTAEQNERADEELKKLLAERGMRFEAIAAFHPDGSAYEHSCAIAGASAREAEELCERFRQGGYFWATKDGQIELVLVG